MYPRENFTHHIPCLFLSFFFFNFYSYIWKKSIIIRILFYIERDPLNSSHNCLCAIISVRWWQDGDGCYTYLTNLINLSCLVCLLATAFVLLFQPHGPIRTPQAPSSEVRCRNTVNTTIHVFLISLIHSLISRTNPNFFCLSYRWRNARTHIHLNSTVYRFCCMPVHLFKNDFYIEACISHRNGSLKKKNIFDVSNS